MATLLVVWVAFAGSHAEGITAFVMASATLRLDVVLFPAVGWTYWFAWLVIFLFACFMVRR